MTSPKAQLLQSNIRYDRPFAVQLGRRTYHCRYLKEWVSGRISYLIADSEPNPEADAREMLRLMRKNNTKTSKCVSLLILGSFWKIILFHWLFWRLIYIRRTGRELNEALVTVYEAMDLSFFFQNTVLLDQMNTLRKRMTKTELKQLSQELQSGKNPLL
jgi:hypothetical protein